MKFYPERSQFMNNLIMTLIGFLVTMGFILRFSESILLKSLMMLLMFILIILSGYYFVLLKTLYYEINDDNIVIGSVFRFLNHTIPLKDIRFFTERITLLNHSGLAGMLSKRFSVGKGYMRGLGKVDMYITSSRKTIYFGTDYRNYAISPENMAAFSQALLKKGIPEKFPQRPLLESDILESDEKLKQYFILNTLMILTYIGVPLILFYQNSLPEYMSTHQLDTSTISYLPVKVFLDRIVMVGISAFFLNLLVLFGGKVYERIDRIYYYRVMLIPIVISSLLLLNLANVLIPVFL